MVIDDYNALKDMLQELRREVKALKKQMETNTERILEIERRLKVFNDAEPEDFKVFSPRTMEAAHREEIRQIKDEKARLEEQNKELNQRRETQGRYARTLEKVLKFREESSCMEREEADRLHRESMEALDQTVQKIEQSSALIVKNPTQARQDFAVISREIRETVDRIRDTVWIV